MIDFEDINKRIDKYYPFHMKEYKDGFREGQKEIVIEMVKSYLQGKKYFILEAPTGVGKSLIGYVAAKTINSYIEETLDEDEEITLPKVILLTKTKILQHQYEGSFNDLPSLWSSNGYSCNLKPDDPEAYYRSSKCDGVKCEVHKQCNYVLARNKFKHSDYGILNNHFFLNARDYSPLISGYDECHKLESTLCDFLTVKISPMEIESVLVKLIQLGLTYIVDFHTLTEILVPAFREIVNVKSKDWLNEVKDSIITVIEPLLEISSSLRELGEKIHLNQIVFETEKRKAILSADKHVNSLVYKFFRILKTKIEWVMLEQEQGRSITIKPLYAHEEAHSLFERSKFVICMSATISGIAKFTETLNIKEEEYSSLEVDSRVPVENRQIVSVGLPGMNYQNKNETLPIYVEMIDNILDQATKQRGVIHTVSYDNAEYILKHSKHRKRMFIPKSSDMMNIKAILMAREDLILVSPSLIEGADLKDELCRVIIFFKVPYPSLTDKWIKRRLELDKEWYQRETLQAIIQGCGRGVRSATDYATTFILDGNFNTLRRNKKIMPKWFDRAIVDM